MNDNKPLVSIIMPVYNGERFLSAAIESVLSQSYENWELLIIDDGSADNSVSITEAYSEKDGRVKLFKNQTGEHGPGNARNCGIDRIRGRYTYFIDADDWIEKDLLECTVALAEKTGADIVPFGFIIEDNGKKIKKPLKPCGNFTIEDFKGVANEIIRGTWAECHELIRSDIIKDVRHNKYKTCEDICFQLDLLCNVKKVCGIDREFYHYRIVNDSVSHGSEWDSLFAEQSIALWERERKFLEYCGLDETSQMMKNTAIERYTGCLYWMCKQICPLPLTEKFRLIRQIGSTMEIIKYKNEFDCTEYSGMRRVAKSLVKHNMEKLMLLVGTLYFKIK